MQADIYDDADAALPSHKNGYEEAFLDKLEGDIVKHPHKRSFFESVWFLLIFLILILVLGGALGVVLAQEQLALGI